MVSVKCSPDEVNIDSAVMGQALMARIAQQQAEQTVSAAAAEAGVPKNPDAAWWLKMLARGLGVLGGGGYCVFFFMPFCNVHSLCLYCESNTVTNIGCRYSCGSL